MTVYLLAHGSVDPRHAAQVATIADHLSGRLDRPVRACYLDLCAPALADVADQPGVVVPLLFSPGYHVQYDVGQAIATADVPLSLASPPLLTDAPAWAAELLAEVRAEWPEHRPVLVTAGTRDTGVLAAWDRTAEALGVPVAHASGPGRRAAQVLDEGSVAVPLLVAPGHFGDIVADAADTAGASIASVAGTSQALQAELRRVVLAADTPG